MESKANVTALIEAYKKQKPLWNKRSPIRHKNYRTACMEQITKELNLQLKKDLKWIQVSALIMHLCRKYREELKLSKEHQEKNIEYKCSWYFERLQFLKPFMENNYISKLDPELPVLLPEQIIEIFHIYRDFPNLWNTNIIEHRCKNKRREAEMEMIEALESKMNIKISVECLNKYLGNVHYYFGKCKRNKIQQQQNNIDNVNDSDEYYEHIAFLYDHIGPFICPVCEQQFQSPFRFKIHKSQHDGSPPFTCSLCGMGISKMLAYDFHARRHMEDFEDVCQECGRQFLHSNALKIHMRQHAGSKPYCCEVCGASFRHIQSFQCHKRKHDKRYLHTCEICSKGFYTKAKMNDHMKTHSNVRDCICKTCGKAFKTLNSLRTHEAIHLDIRKYVCTICGKAFKITNGLNQHMKTHGVKLGEEKSGAVNRSFNKKLT